jgi:hypothetical protein
MVPGFQITFAKVFFLLSPRYINFSPVCQFFDNRENICIAGAESFFFNRQPEVILA